jgi:hypothetical protein
MSATSRVMISSSLGMVSHAEGGKMVGSVGSVTLSEPRRSPVRVRAGLRAGEAAVLAAVDRFAWAPWLSSRMDGVQLGLLLGPARGWVDHVLELLVNAGADLWGDR